MQLVQVQLQEGQPLLPQVRKGCHIYLWIYGLLIVCWVFVTSPSTYFDDRLIYTEQAAPAAPSVPSRAARRNQLRVATWEGSLTPLVDSYTAGVQHENRLLAALNTIAFWSHLEDDVSFNFRILAHHGPCDSQPNTVFCDKRTPVIWVSRQRLGVFRLREKKHAALAAENVSCRPEGLERLRSCWRKACCNTFLKHQNWRCNFSRHNMEVDKLSFFFGCEGLSCKQGGSCQSEVWGLAG